MNISIKTTKLDLTPSIKEYVEEKVERLGRFIKAQEAKVELGRDQHHNKGDVFRAEIMLFLGSKVMRAEAESGDIYASVDLVIPKLKEQISKFKDKREALWKRGARKAKRKV